MSTTAQKEDAAIFLAGQKGRFEKNPYLQSSHHWETFEFGKRLPDKEFESRKGSTILLATGERYKLTYYAKGVVAMDKII